jgi:hypothetical protein
MAYIYPAPGVSGVQLTLNLKVGSDTLGLNVPALQDVTVNNANDVFTWTQLDTGSKLQIATTSTNSLSGNIVLDQDTFFGVTTSGEVAKTKGIFGLSKDKQIVNFSLYMGDESDGSNGKTLSGEGYITGLAPTVSADAPVWVTPVTLTITGDFTVA